jgi:hypothetical protein
MRSPPNDLCQLVSVRGLLPEPSRHRPPPARGPQPRWRRPVLWRREPGSMSRFSVVLLFPVRRPAGPGNGLRLSPRLHAVLTPQTGLPSRRRQPKLMASPGPGAGENLHPPACPPSSGCPLSGSPGSCHQTTACRWCPDGETHPVGLGHESPASRGVDPGLSAGCVQNPGQRLQAHPGGGAQSDQDKPRCLRRRGRQGFRHNPSPPSLPLRRTAHGQ